MNTRTRLGAWLAAAMVLAGGMARGNDIYVSTNASPGTPYASWASGFTNLQEALDYAQPGDTIYLAGQTLTGPAMSTTHPSNTVFFWRNATNVALRGGYEADPGGSLPGNRNSTQWPTILARSAGSVRVLTMSAVSNCVIEQVTIRGGSPTDGGGGGVYLSACRDVTFAGCQIVGNTSSGHGGGLYLANSSMVLTDAIVTNNAASDFNNSPYGGGVYLDGSSRLAVTGSTIRANQASSYWGTSLGGGFYVVSGGALDVVGSVLDGNGSSGRSGYPGNSSGGGIYIASGATAQLDKTVLKGNTTRYNGGAVRNAGGTLLMRNCLVAGNSSAGTDDDGLLLSSGAATLINCTIADHTKIGVSYVSGSVAVTNCIVWGNGTADLAGFPKNSDGVLTNVWYSSIGDGQNHTWQGCVTVNPLFADRVTYHLQSTVSNYAGGYFTGGSWTTSPSNSPLIDRGDPVSDYSKEPIPNGGRINMGAYGNTEVASKTLEIVAVLPTVTNRGAAAWGHRTAVLRGEVLSTGGQVPQASFRYWLSGGAVTNEVAMGEQSGAFESSLGGLTPGAAYQYLVLASNSAGAAVSDVAAFLMNPSPSVFYVATNGNNTAGTNWATAFTDLQATLTMVEPGDVIYLAGQTFAGGAAGTPPAHPDNTVFSLKNATNVTLRGGYEASLALPPANHPGPRDSAQWPTTLSRTVGSLRVLTLSAVSNGVIEQVAILNGSPTSGGGGGVYLSACRDVTFADCRIVGNTATESAGGGLYLANSYVTFADGRIAGNTATTSGGAHVDGSSRLTVSGATIQTNQAMSQWGTSFGGAFHVASGGALEVYDAVLQGNAVAGRADNQANNSGGGIYIASGATAQLDKTVLKGNTTRYNGGAVRNVGGTLLMRNCLVVKNTSSGTADDGILLSSGAAILVNCTVADNNNIGVSYAGGSVAVTNCIVWGHNTADLASFPTNTAGVLLSVGYSAFAVPNTMDGVNGCTTNNPLFVNAATNDYRLQEGSPVINRGLNQDWMADATDLDGNPRIQNRAVDMGAYEILVPPSGTLILLR